jgi:molybdenum cofactor biosynthesis enzyme MoaA
MVRPDGEYAICCLHRTPVDQRLNVNRDVYGAWKESNYVREVRESFVNDQRHAGCHMCWHHEDRGIISQRQRTSREYKILGIDVNRPKLTNIELDVGNLCNLKCLMCDEYNSSAILAENRKLGINVLDQRDIAWNDTAFDNIKTMLDQKPSVINIRGGEPFYNKKLLSLINSISDEDAKNICLHITTNATIWGEAWQQALQRFRLIRFMFSVDAVGKPYEYIRHPADWSTVDSNISNMMTQTNAKTMVHAVVSNLNIGYLGELIDWSQDKSIYLELDALIDPPYLQIQNLPDSYKSIVLDRLDQWLTKHYPDHIITVLKGFSEVLKQSKHDPVLWAQFQNDIGRRDNLRGNNYQDFIT